MNAQNDTFQLDHLINLPSPLQISQDIASHGYRIYKNVVVESVISDLRNFWMDFFSKNKSDRRFVSGNVFLGEKNFRSYSETKEWCMYRHFDFLWNECEHELTRELHLKIHRHRNLAQGFEEQEGLRYNDRNYGIYISTSYYPPGKGFLTAHSDGHQSTPILHYMLPLTFKGTDYKAGGLVCEDRNGNMADVDADMSLGDVVFFDGRMKHAVEKIIPGSNGPQVGRLAIFAIPTFFLRDASFGVVKRSARISVYELLELLRIKSVVQGLRGRV